jgi:hypothetical protein
MRKTWVVAATVLTTCAISVAASGLRAADQAGSPVLRARSTIVSVDVSVRSRNRPVANLSASDFVVTDNAVPQKIELVDVASVPVDVSLVVDLSHSTSDSLERYREDVEAIAAIIRPSDRLRVVGFARDVGEILPLSRAGTRPQVERMTTGAFGGAGSSVHDGLVAAFLRRVELGRRHLIVAFTDGADNTSIVSFADLTAVARRSESVLHLSGSNNERLNALAKDTGGGHHGGLFRRSIRGVFESIYAAFRESYVLRYSPTGVEAGGWHVITVKLTRSGQFEIRARRGYFDQ